LNTAAAKSPDSSTDEPVETASVEPAAAEPETESAEQIKRLESRLRDQGKLQKKIATLEAAAQAQADAQLSEVELLRKASTERDQADSQRLLDDQATRLELEAMRIAFALGMRRPERGAEEIRKAEVEWDDGEPVNVKALLVAEIAARPELLGTYSDSPDLGLGRGKKSMLTREQVRAMSPDEINDRWGEVREMLKHPA